jgi:hypothetical protein
MGATIDRKGGGMAKKSFASEDCARDELSVFLIGIARRLESRPAAPCGPCGKRPPNGLAWTSLGPAPAVLNLAVPHASAVAGSTGLPGNYT